MLHITVKLRKFLMFMMACGFLASSSNADKLPPSLELLNRLVEMNSHSANLAGIQKVRSILVPEFKKLGFEMKSHAVEMGHEVTSFDFPGEHPRILLIGHLDTVFPESKGRGKVGIEGERIYGPGIIDMKGGIVVLLKSLESLTLAERKKVRIILNDDEELASIYSRKKVAELSTGIPYGLVFEPGTPDGALVTSASGGQWIKLKVKGKAAHAGMEHALGLNACAELSHKITRLHGLTQYSKNVTLNIGVMEGGTQPNVVCEEASVVLDIRYVDPKDLDILLAQISAVAKEVHVKNSSLGLLPMASLETLAVVPSMPETATAGLFELAKKAAFKQGKQVQGAHVGYATDGNHLVKTGMSLLVGLGPYGGGLHTGQEFMKRETLEERISLSIQLMQDLLSKAPSAEGISKNQVSGVRIKSFSEVMSPSLGNGNLYVPKPSGEPFVPAFLSGQLGVDYEFTPGYRVLYLQKGLAIAPSHQGGRTSGRFLDPRFGIRKTDQFTGKRLTTDSDLFIQPGIAQAFIRQPNRSFDLGIRFSNRYSVPATAWSIGGNFEFISTFFSAEGRAANFSGLINLNSSYRVSKAFATQHGIMSFYKHLRGDPLSQFSWDITGMPYFQNGVSVNVMRDLSISLLLNNYAFEVPKVQNIWTSIWISFHFEEKKLS